MTFNIEFTSDTAIVRIQEFWTFGNGRIFESNIQVVVYGILKKEKNIQTIAIDLKNVEYLSSSGLGALVVCHKEAEIKGINFGVFNVNKEILSTFKVSSLDQYLQIYNEKELTAPFSQIGQKVRLQSVKRMEP